MGDQQTTNKLAHLKWRIIVCETGDEPRKISKVWRLESYLAALSYVRSTLLRQKQIWYTQYTAPVSHGRDDPMWVRAEAILETRYCAINMTRIFQIEYQKGVEDCPVDLFTVPRPPGMCWRCDRRLDIGERSFCPKCKQLRRRLFNALSTKAARLKKPRR